MYGDLLHNIQCTSNVKHLFWSSHFYNNDKLQCCTCPTVGPGHELGWIEQPAEWHCNHSIRRKCRRRGGEKNV